ncbi:MAG: type II toxin-antitoxin system PemK/MazF family toxin [Nitrospirae bacterium]|nr:MAG: type II toxin-antitoxin system PemK/MazF family toxin [Nitrospirota bacterium]
MKSWRNKNLEDIKQGDIYWVDFGDPDGSEPAYKHPCVVVQNNVFNKSKIKTVVVCLITSNLRRAEAPGNVLIKKGEGNLKKDSVVNISQILTVNKKDLIKKIGALNTGKINRIIEGIKILIEPRDI